MFRKSSQSGFTLIELLATLTIMAIMAGVLFPFISDYTTKAKDNTNLRSLKLFQDAMDRYQAIGGVITAGTAGTTSPSGASWTAANGKPTTSTMRLWIAEADETNIIRDISTPFTNTENVNTQTLKASSPILVNTCVEIFAEGTTPVFYLARYRPQSNVDGISRDSKHLINSAGTSAITAANNTFPTDGTDPFTIAAAVKSPGTMVDAGGANALP